MKAIKTDINNLKNTLTEKQYKSFINTKLKLTDGKIVTGEEFLRKLIVEKYTITEGKGNSYTVRSVNNKLSYILNAVEAKIFNVMLKGGKGEIYSIGYNYSIK